MSETNYPRIRVQKQPPVPRIRLRVLPSLLPLDVSMQATATEIQWRVGDGPWQDLIPLSAFAPPAGDILALLLTVDGAGSGLDADLLDGRNSSTYQTQDAGLDALAAVTGAGILVETATDTYALRTLQPPAAGITVTNPAGTAGDPTLVLANDLAALEGLASTGFAARTATDTWAQRSLANAAAGITWTNPAGIAGNPTPVLANDLAALEGLGSTGIAVRTAADTWAQRSIAVPAAGIGISNADGSAGNPTLSLANDLAALEALSGTSTIYYRSGVDTWTAVTVNANLGFSAGTLGSALGTMATQGAGAVAITGGSVTGITDIAVADGGTGSSTAAGARTNLGVAIGTDVEAWSARLDDLAGASWAQGDIAYYNGTNLVRLAAGSSGNFLKTLGAGANPTWAAVPGGGDLLSTNNLSDLTNKPTALTNIGAVAKAGDTMTGDLTFSGGKGILAAAYLNGGTIGNLARNILYNGNFDIWQRGTSSSASTGSGVNFPLPDRWSCQRFGTATVTVSRQSHGAADFSGCPAFFYRYAHSVAGTGGTFENICQEYIENVVRGTAGKTYTLTFWAKADAARSLGLSITQNFGTGGSPSTQVGNTPANVSLTTAWQKFTTTVSLASVAAKTFGTNNDDVLIIQFTAVALNTVQTIDLSHISLVEGDATAEADPYGVPVPQAMELARCQRYYEKSFAYATAPAQNAGFLGAEYINLPTGGTGPFGEKVPFKAVKRTAPTIVTFNPGAANANWRDSGNAADRTVTVSNITDSGFDVTGASGVAGSLNFIHWTADCEF